MVNRRDFLRHSLISATGLSLFGWNGWAEAQTEIRRADVSKKVVIIGAGLAGERLSLTVSQIEMVHPAIRTYFEGGSSVCWDNEQWSRGAYAWFRPGEMTSLLRHIVSPEGRIHFAGDHTSPAPGWMNGALQSGNRVAREVTARQN